MKQQPAELAQTLAERADGEFVNEASLSSENAGSSKPGFWGHVLQLQSWQEKCIGLGFLVASKEF